MWLKTSSNSGRILCQSLKVSHTTCHKHLSSLLEIPSQIYSDSLSKATYSFDPCSPDKAWSSASPRGQWRTGKMEKSGCKIICGAPTTLAVKGLMMMMMMSTDLTLPVYFSVKPVVTVLSASSLWTFSLTGKVCSRVVTASSRPFPRSSLPSAQGECEDFFFSFFTAV